MRIIQTGDLTPESIARMGATEKLWVYNGLDCGVTLEILHEIKPQLDNTTNNTYEFEKALQGPILELNMHGTLIDNQRKWEVIKAYEKDIAAIQSSLEEILWEGLEVRLNHRSPAQLKELFYQTLQVPAIKKRNSKGAYAPTVNREALEKISDYFHARPIAKHILALRDLEKKVSTLKTEVDRDGRWRTSYNIGGTTTGRLSSSFNDMGTGCVLPTAEVLTREGWQRIESIVDGTEIAQYNQGIIEFAPCTIHRQNFSGQMISLRSEQFCLDVTPAHRMLYCDYNNPVYRVTTAKTLFKNYQAKIPLSGSYIGGDVDYPAYLPMLMADFSKEGSGWRGSFKKERKRNRFFQLAHEFGFYFREHKAKEGYQRFYIPGYLELPKEWGPWILNLSPACAENLLEEARHWDAYDRGSGFIFFTADKEQAEWFATLAHITGKSATIRIQEQSPGSYSTTTMYLVNVKNRDFANIIPKHWSSFDYEGEVFCPTVPSSYWLVRQNGFISVTGNSNAQNIEERLREIFIADPGMKMAYIDLEQAESRAVGAICYNLFGHHNYLDACESGDLHTSVVKMCWPDMGWTGDLKHDKELAEQPFYRQHSYRHMCKVLGHGSNYRGRPFTMSQHTKIDKSIIANFQTLYFTGFPEIPMWHEYVADTIRREGVLTSLMGRRRHFFGRRDDDSTIREAVAFDPQSSVADILNGGMLRVWRAAICQLLMQIHDAILIQYPEQDEDIILPQVTKLLITPVELRNNRTLIIPCDVMSGWNWRKFSEGENPDGLKKYRGHDDRTRTRHPPNIQLD